MNAAADEAVIVRSARLSFPTEQIPITGKCPVWWWPLFGGQPGAIVQYLREKQEIFDRGRSSSKECTDSLDVLAWLLDQDNHHYETMTIAYGGLIHIFCEGEFVRPDKSYIDDDIDTWVTPSTVQLIVELEDELWHKFGWTLRLFQNCQQHTVFGQLVASCGHKYETKSNKAVQDYPQIELYVLQTDPVTRIARGLWQGPTFPTKLIFPTVPLSFRSAGTNATLHLQIPHYSKAFMACFYGDWSVPSSKHAELGKSADCLLEAAIKQTSVTGTRRLRGFDFLSTYTRFY